MDAENTLQLVLDATTNVPTALYTPPPRPEAPLPDDDPTARRRQHGRRAPADAKRPKPLPRQTPTPPSRWTPPHINPDAPNWDTLTAAAVAHTAGPPTRWTTTPRWPSSNAAAAPPSRCQFPCGQVVDGSFELELDPSRMSALLTLHPPKGGQPVTLDVVRHAIADRGIVHGVLEQALAKLVGRAAAETRDDCQARRPRAALHPF